MICCRRARLLVAGSERASASSTETEASRVPKILQRDVHPGKFAQELVDLPRIRGMKRAIAIAILEQAMARQLLQNVDRACQLRRLDFFLDQFTPLGFEAQLDGFAIHRDVRFEQRCRAARAA